MSAWAWMIAAPAAAGGCHCQLEPVAAGGRFSLAAASPAVNRRTRVRTISGLLGLLILMAGATARAEAPALQLTERFGVAHPEQLVEFNLPEPLSAGNWSARDDQGAMRPAQRLGDGRRVAVLTDLPANANQTLTLVRERPVSLVKDPVVVRTNAASLELGNALVGIRLPLSGSPTPANAPAPLLGLRLGQRPWLDAGSNRMAFAGGHEELRINGLEARVIEAGPLVAEAEVIYTLDRPELLYGQTVIAPKGPGRYVARFRLEAGQPSVMVTEETDTQFAWTLDLPGLRVDEARYRGHYSTDVRWGREPDGQQYRPGHARPSLDAVMDLPFDRDYLPGWRMSAEEGFFRRLPVWDLWTYDGGWYWQFYAKDGGAETPLLGLFAGRASLGRDFGEAGAGLLIRGAKREVGLGSSAQHRTGSAAIMPQPRFQWGLFAGSRGDLRAPDQVQLINEQLNLHAGFNLTWLAEVPSSFTDPPQGFGSPFLPRATLDRLKAALRADTKGIHGDGLAGQLARRDPQARELIEFWADPSAARLSNVVARVSTLAHDLVEALALRDGIYNRRFHYWHGGLEMSRALLWIDQALASDGLVDTDRARLKAAAALFGAVLWNDDFVPMNNPRGVNLGTPNMPVQQAGYRDQFAVFLAADPAMRVRAEAAAARVQAVLAGEINEHGAHLACVHYIGASFGPTLSLMQQLQQAGVTNLFATEPRLEKFAEFLLQCATPPEPRFGGRRKMISVGDSATESSELPGQLGTAFAAANPALSRRLMGMWQAQGAIHSSFHGTTLMKIDDTLPTADAAAGSASFPGQFTVLRHGWGTPRESAVWMLTGNHAVDHVHADEGSLIIYAEGAPVSLDWGSMYEPRSAGALMHSVALPERMFDRPWNTDSLPFEYGGDLWGNYGGTRTTVEEFHGDTHGGWVRSRMLAPDKSFTWTRAVSSAPLGQSATVVAIQDSFSGDGAKGGRIFTLNLCADGDVETPAGKMSPPLRLRGYGQNQPDRRENPSAGPVFPLPAGVNRLRFTGQSWPKHPAGGVDFDVFIVADQPQQAFIGHWAHAWHPGTEQREFQEANGRVFEERQHILRMRGEGGFRVLLIAWPKTTPRPEVMVNPAASGLRLATGTTRLRLTPDGEISAGE
jgi:hypothetical protein